MESEKKGREKEVREGGGKRGRVEEREGGGERK